MIKIVRQNRLLMLLVFMAAQLCAYGENINLKEEGFDTTNTFLQIVMWLISLPMGLIGIATCVYLFMLIFMRRKLYAKIDNYAGMKVTPDGFFSKVQLQGILPVAIFAFLMFFGMGILVNIVHGVSVVLLALAVEALAFAALFFYCRWWVRRNSNNMPVRAAKATLFFAIMSICAAIEIVIIAMYVVIIALMIVLGLFLVNVALGSMAGSGSGSSSGSSSSSSGNICSNCKFYDCGRCGLNGRDMRYNDKCGQFEHY